jgi:predicted RNA-binding protein associated with RNAse of E/G family
VSALPLYAAGADVVVEERWHGILWAAVPHRVVQSTPDLLVGWVPAGTLAVYATNRGLPQAEGLTRDQRKLLALKTLTARASEFAETPSKLSIFRPDRWGRINLGFDPQDGHFLGWYVDFQLPIQPTSHGLVTKDLVLDLWINPDHTWHWKDQADYETAISQHLVDASTRLHLEREAEQVLDELGRGEVPFSEEFSHFRPDRAWPAPVLPASQAWGGTAWSLPSGWRAESTVR